MMMRPSPLAVSVLLLLSACTTVGPDYQRPAQVLPQQLAAPDSASVAALADAGVTMRPDPFKAPDASWWSLFGAPRLDALVARTLQNNPGVMAGQAALRAANEQVTAQRGLFLPQLGAGYTVTPQRMATTLSSSLTNNDNVFNLHTAQFVVNYTPDVFGLNARTVEGLQAQADGQRYLLDATRNLLAATVVGAAINEALTRSQIEAVQAQLDLQQRQLTAQQQLYRAGAMGEADLRLQEQAVATSQAALPPLRKQLDTLRDQLKVLAGLFPGDTLEETFTLDDLHLPADIPLVQPSSLLERRPDIMAAEANLKVASAAIGVAAANRLPTVSLGTDYLGKAALSFGDLFKSDGLFWSVTAGIAGPLYDGGTLAARERAARATYEQAAAQYRQAVLNAFQNVGDALVAVRADADALQTQQRLAVAAGRSVQIARAQQAAGDLSALAVFPLEQALLQARLNVRQAQANRLLDAAGVCVALGGGWSDAGTAASAVTAASPR